MLAGVRAAFDVAPAWTALELRHGPADVRATSFRRPAAPSSPEAEVRYYRPAGESLAASARRGGFARPEDVVLTLQEDGPLVTVRLGPAEIAPAPEAAPAAPEPVEAVAVRAPSGKRRSKRRVVRGGTGRRRSR